LRTVQLSEAKAKLSSLLDFVESRDEEVVITRHGRPAAVLVSPADFESWKKTASVRADVAADFESWKKTASVRADVDLAAEIRRGLSSLKRGKAKLYTLEELFAD
jgi:antitoxin YefM